MHDTIKLSSKRVVFIILLTPLCNCAPPRPSLFKGRKLQVLVERNVSVAAHTNNAHPIANPRNLMRCEPILGAQQKILERTIGIFDLAIKLGLQKCVEALPELGRGDDDLLGGRLRRAGGDGERIEIEGDLRVGRRVGWVRGKWEALAYKEWGRLARRSSG